MVGGDGVLAAAAKASQTHPVHISISHGALKADAYYPVSDYNAPNVENAASGPVNATRFHVVVNDRVAVDKLVDNMPVALRIVTAQGGKPLVMLDTYSGGAHCCFASATVEPQAGGIVAFCTHDWADLGYKTMRSADGSGYVFLTGDIATAYEFSSFAGSTFPVLILTYRNGTFADATDQYRHIIELDAGRHWKEFLTDAHSNAAPDSALVAYLADEYRLGDQQTAWKRVHAADGNDADFERKALTWLQTNGYARNSK